jgi:hypothetical protein
MHVQISHRIRPAFLTLAAAAALISLAITLLGPQGGRIDWIVVGVPLGLLAGVAASALDPRSKARIILGLVALALCAASAVLILLRMSH